MDNETNKKEKVIISYENNVINERIITEIGKVKKEGNRIIVQFTLETTSNHYIKEDDNLSEKSKN